MRARRRDYSTVSFVGELSRCILAVCVYFVLLFIPLYGFEDRGFSAFYRYGLLIGAGLGSVASLGVWPLLMGTYTFYCFSLAALYLPPRSMLRRHIASVSISQLWLLFTFVGAAGFVFVTDQSSLIGSLSLFLQLSVGSIAVYFLSWMITKTGIIKGEYLLITVQIAFALFRSLFGYIERGVFEPTGKVMNLMVSVVTGDTDGFILSGFPLVVFVTVFAVCVLCQGIRIAVPIGVKRGGHKRCVVAYFSAPRVAFPHITAANVMFFNMVMMSLCLEKIFHLSPSRFEGGYAIRGLIYYVSSMSLFSSIIDGSLRPLFVAVALGHCCFYLLMTLGSVCVWRLLAGTKQAHVNYTTYFLKAVHLNSKSSEFCFNTEWYSYADRIAVLSTLAMSVVVGLLDSTGVLIGGVYLLILVTCGSLIHRKVSLRIRGIRRMRRKRFLKKAGKIKPFYSIPFPGWKLSLKRVTVYLLYVSCYGLLLYVLWLLFIGDFNEALSFWLHPRN